jgi:hypothetical protein
MLGWPRGSPAGGSTFALTRSRWRLDLPAYGEFADLGTFYSTERRSRAGTQGRKAAELIAAPLRWG